MSRKETGGVSTVTPPRGGHTGAGHSDAVAFLLSPLSETCKLLETHRCEHGSPRSF